MGAVWLAEHSEPVKRRGAIKIIKSGMFSTRALQRFDLERQALAIMNHPAIAKVFDAGSTSTGQPYFVMEYVSGMPITTNCNQKHLGPRERIALMIKVCEGVQHAHQKAIMHRDLKPSNILITEIDGKPVPRIIDFGIAKATQESGLDETVEAFTQAGGTVGTLGYMSPEQADPSVKDVDTRTDVYSLGVVLYELLTASLPFDAKQWRTKPMHEVLRQLHEEDSQRPSTRVGTDATDAAEKSGTDTQKLVSQLRGDLDWITLKALERDRERRYKSPAESKRSSPSPTARFVPMKFPHTMRHENASASPEHRHLLYSRLASFLPVPAKFASRLQAVVIGIESHFKFFGIRANHSFSCIVRAFSSLIKCQYDQDRGVFESSRDSRFRRPACR